METKTVTLKYPFKRDKEEPIKELHFREPIGRDIMIVQNYQNEPMTGSIVLAAKLCKEGLSPEEIQGLCATDVMKINEAVGEWLAPDGQSSGASLPISQPASLPPSNISKG